MLFVIDNHNDEFEEESTNILPVEANQESTMIALSECWHYSVQQSNKTTSDSVSVIFNLAYF